MSTKFDITSLLNFNPPRFFCPKCYGLFQSIRVEYQRTKYICPICSVEVIPSQEYPSYSISQYYTDNNYEIKYDNLNDHSKKMASISSKVRKYLKNKNDYVSIPPMRGLLALLSESRYFIHFATYGISHLLLGALKVIGQKVPVRGIVAGVDNNALDELRKYPEECPGLLINIFERTGMPDGWDNTPHQKIIIIDGLVAFKGSANLTVSGWRKAAQGRDVIDIVTDIQEVVELNNRFFSPVWAEFFPDIKQIETEKLPF